MDRTPHPTPRSTLGVQIPRPSPSKCIRDAACAIPTTKNRLWGEEQSGSYFVGFHRNRSTQPTAFPLLPPPFYSPKWGRNESWGYFTNNITSKKTSHSPLNHKLFVGRRKCFGTLTIYGAGHSPAATNHKLHMLGFGKSPQPNLQQSPSYLPHFTNQNGGGMNRGNIFEEHNLQEKPLTLPSPHNQKQFVGRGTVAIIIRSPNKLICDWPKGVVKYLECK